MGGLLGKAPGRTLWSSIFAPTPRRGWRRSSALRASHTAVGIFAVAASPEPDLILQAMRAGANEFFLDPRRCDAGVPRDGGVVPRRRPPHGRPTGRGERRRQAAVRDARVPRREGRRGHDDRRRQLRGGTGAPDEEADRHPRPEALPRRGRAVSRRAPAVHGPRRDREPAPPRQGLPPRARLEAQVGSRHYRRLRAVRPAQRAGRRGDRRAAARALARLRIHRHRRRQHDQRVRRRGALRRGHRVPRDQPRRAVDSQRAAAGRASGSSARAASA